MTTFTYGKITIACESKSRRGGFKHVATLLIAGHQRCTTKQLWVNRTWESFTYQSVLQEILDRADFLTKRQVSGIRNKYGI